MTVTAVTAVYNGEAFVGEAIDSVLAQTWTDLEYIVVDDGSTDRTAEVVAARAARDSRVRCVRQENRGVSSARNVGMALARGELIAFLDADDIWLPGKLEAQVEVFRRRPEVGLVFCGYFIVDERRRPRSAVIPGRQTFDMLSWLLLEGDGMGLPFTGVVPRRVVEELGGFDETLSTSADLDFAYRIASRLPVEAVPEPLSLYRSHTGQMHLDVVAFEHDVLRLYDQHLGGSGSMSALRRRGTANLHARVALMSLLGRDFRRARSAAAATVRMRPISLVAIPLRIGARRIGRRLRLLAHRVRRVRRSA